MLKFSLKWYKLSPVKRICVFEHSVMTNFNCACTAIQRGQRSDFLSEGSSWLTACISEQRRFFFSTSTHILLAGRILSIAKQKQCCESKECSKLQLVVHRIAMPNFKQLTRKKKTTKKTHTKKKQQQQQQETNDLTPLVYALKDRDSCEKSYLITRLARSFV